MSGLAKLLLENSATVTGSDTQPTTTTENLRQLGANIKIGHAKNNLTDNVDAVVISAAIKEDNPELISARQKGCKIYKYAEMLGELMDDFRGIAVCGTHGKSTTSGWLAYVLRQTGIEANFIIGAEVPQLGSSSGVSAANQYFVAEACEYDRSFLNLHPEIAVILNIEQDHLDYYKDEIEIVETFTEFAGGIKTDGVIIANAEDINVRDVLSTLDGQHEFITFGFDERHNFSARNIKLTDGLYKFDVYNNQNPLGPAKISLPGRHNILNALAVIASAVLAGAQSEDILAAIGLFTGIDRRLMLKDRVCGITVLDDYAHHPTEIKASLEAIRQRYQPKRLWCVFQPHQYSRTRFLLDDFAESFKLADVTIVPQIYFVRDSAEAKKQVNAELLVEKITEKGSHAIFIDDFTAICGYLKDNVKAGDLVVTMGAGDIWKVADEFIQRLGTDS